MAEETLGLNLDRTFDPGPEFPHPSLLSRTMAMLAAEAAVTGRAIRRQNGPVDRSDTRSPRRQISLPRPAMQLAAALMLIAVAVAAVAVFLATHHPLGPTPVHPPPFQIKAPGAYVCGPTASPTTDQLGHINAPPTACSVGQPLFTAGNEGWVTEGHSLPPPVTTTVLFRTSDGGLTWHAQLSWNGPGADVIRSSADGMQALAWGQEMQDPHQLYYTIDGGAHWEGSSLPPTAVDPGGILSDTQMYFLNPREGWVLTREALEGFADLFHTTDSGVHWIRIARIDMNAQFNLLQGRLYGQMVFRDSSTGWLVPRPGPCSSCPGGWKPSAGAYIYVTHDGGSTWQVHSLQLPTAEESSGYDLAQFFANGDGLLRVDTQSAQYVYGTSDGGDHWSPPTKLLDLNTNRAAGVVISFIDAKQWVGWFPSSGWMRTGDGGLQWEVLAQSSAHRYLGGLIYLDFTDRSRGWATVGRPEGEALYGTSDGGLTWIPLSLPELK